MLAGKQYERTEPDEREAWLELFYPECEASAFAELPDDAKPARRWEGVKSIVLPRWRVYLRGPRELRGISERRAKEARMASWEAEHLPKLRAVEALETAIGRKT